MTMKKLHFIFFLSCATIICRAQDNNLATFPIQLRYLTAEKQNTDAAVIKWLAPCQTSEATFEIQYSTDAQNFSTVYTITADQQRCLEPFQYKDYRLLSGRNYYRIRLITPSNLAINSFIIPVIAKDAGLELQSFWPSVVTGSTMLNFSNGKEEKISFTITDLSGRVVEQFTQQSKQGNNQIQLQLSHYRAGHYVLVAVNASHEKRVLRFQKQ